MHRRRAEWNETSTGWLNLMIPALQAHAVRVANGDLGVLDLNVETDEMQGALSGGMAADKTIQRPGETLTGPLNVEEEFRILILASVHAAHPTARPARR